MSLPDFWNKYPESELPFLAKQRSEWAVKKPLKNVRILHNTPLTVETLMKVDCLIAAGALVTLTRTKFIRPEESSELHQLIEKLNLRYIPEHKHLISMKQDFDLVLDCGAELLHLIEPKHGFVELTGSGTVEFQKNAKKLTVPAISIDDSKTKQLETFFGTANGCVRALESLSNIKLDNQNIVLFGYGRVGSGIVYGLLPYSLNITVVDVNPDALEKAKNKGLQSIDPSETGRLNQAIAKADIIITAVGRENCISELISAEQCKGKLLANMSAEDDFGTTFDKRDVLGEKQPINFLLESPTLMRYLDPSFYAHNSAAEMIMKNNYAPGYHPFDVNEDLKIVSNWQALFQEDLSVTS